jgi:hypothetical protein
MTGPAAAAARQEKINRLAAYAAFPGQVTCGASTATVG